ncbi:MAG: hypothetical protein A2315_00425 [Ignavibacteria bacterium RIFOXYB2_FULL_35_12]|nr:MAG: hypothetical protein A2058_06275 [Ignavibacteria bacterium GWA2_36_19]OGU60595.1 MAG: hypothetical protein A2X60_06690 [Ignavibacteria bacterium GWF2_35_20]OGU82063.1 MAG: hypothetical protein A2254_08790 [Ignavibacteria bacterium RIFOXYA2_FULL_35_9]OGU88153.1 MAG: hypothetical protein A3K31_01980 [Ignavibacteria bacterium RIFOXYA12_FULL_35_25]OGU90420.1 MAG: hypothetical protein A2492_06450 [Ignavibacteria bacterium RIFOXYC12_FULL_35_11]OGU97376.1 MAG: hypothetical protein A2347_06475
MKKVIFFCLCFFLSYQLFAQPFEKKQITNFNYDSRGASFPTYPDWGFSFFSKSPLFFEAHQGNFANLMMMSYDLDSDSFSNPIPVTDNNYWNINPVAEGYDYYPTKKINLIWQTNKNGNWDIAMRTITDSTISEKKFLLSSSENETNPQIVLKNLWMDPNEYEIEFVYEKANSIYLYQQKDSMISNELVFSGNDSTHYFQPTGVHAIAAPWTPPAGLYIAATCQIADSSSKIVYRYKPYGDSIWSEIKTAFDSGFCKSPKFIQNYDFPLLSFEMKIDGVNRILIFPEMSYLGQNQYAEALVDDPNASTSDLESIEYTFVTNKNSRQNLEAVRDFLFFSPHTFKISKNDSTYAVYSPGYWLERVLFHTIVNDTKVAVGNLGIDNNFIAISYTVWEDSSNGHINLFGVKRLDPLGDISDKIISANFILYQNYPNPFNPKTVIKYNILSRDLVTLKIFDVLGNEISTLVNEEKSAGEYKTIFNGSNLASGIYVYRLSVGNHYLSRKMILLK